MGSMTPVSAVRTWQLLREAVAADAHALAAERLCRAVEVVALLDALAHTGGYIRASLTDEDEAFAAHFDGFFERAPVAREGEYEVSGSHTHRSAPRRRPVIPLR